jgi:hypothetical protein
MTLDFTSIYDTHESLFGHRIKFDKDEKRLDYLMMSAEEELDGSSLWLGEWSTEPVDYLCLTDSDPKLLYNAEWDPFINGHVRPFYRAILGANMSQPKVRLHEYAKEIAEPLCAMHADFMGLVGSTHPGNPTSTFTFELIDTITRNLADRCLLAFTHVVKGRNAPKLTARYEGIQVQYDSVFNGTRRNYADDLVGFAKHPLYLICLYLALKADGYHVEPVWSSDYASSTGRGGQQLKMNKTVVRLTKGEFDPAAMFQKIILLRSSCGTVRESSKKGEYGYFPSASACVQHDRERQVERADCKQDWSFCRERARVSS